MRTDSRHNGPNSIFRNFTNVPKDCFVGLSAYLTEKSQSIAIMSNWAVWRHWLPQHTGYDFTTPPSRLCSTAVTPNAWKRGAVYSPPPPQTLYFIQVLHVQRKIIRSLQSKDFQQYSYN
jgi:hypothetical protein